MTSAPRTAVLIIDSSVVMCTLMEKHLEAAEDIAVVGIARDPETALDVAQRLQPDVIAIDPFMRNQQGLNVLASLMRQRPVRIVMVCAASEEDVLLATRDLALGAVEYVAKPMPGVQGELNRMGHELVAAVRRAAAATRRAARGESPSTPRTELTDGSRAQNLFQSRPRSRRLHPDAHLMATGLRRLHSPG